jgi:hypothetical protein
MAFRRREESKMTSCNGATRRHVVTGIAVTFGAAALAPFAAVAQQPITATGAPPTVISNPPRQWGHHAPASIYPDPDVIVIAIHRSQRYGSATTRSTASQPALPGRKGRLGRARDSTSCSACGQPKVLTALPELRGRDLVCWCAPLPCHGDVLLELASKR